MVELFAFMPGLFGVRSFRSTMGFSLDCILPMFILPLRSWIGGRKPTPNRCVFECARIIIIQNVSEPQIIDELKTICGLKLDPAKMQKKFEANRFFFF